MSIYRDLLKTNGEVPSVGIIPALKSSIDKLAGFIDYQRGIGKRSFLFTATEREEGNTLIMSQAALLLSQLNRNLRILLVDANLRFPALHTHFTVSAENGLVDYLGHTEMDLPIQKCNDNLDLIVAGTSYGRQIMSSGLGDFRRLLTEVSGDYDIVLIDSPAARMYADAVVIAPAVDTVILTVAAGISSKGIVKTVIKAIVDAGGQVSGTVFNRRKDEIPAFIYQRL